MDKTLITSYNAARYSDEENAGMRRVPHARSMVALMSSSTLQAPQGQNRKTAWWKVRRHSSLWQDMGKSSFEERLYAPLKPKTCLSLFQTLLPQAQLIEISNKVE